MSGSPTIIEAMESPQCFGASFSGSSWRAWKVALKAALGLKLSKREREIFAAISGGREPPSRRVREFWIVVGRRGGKDSVASLIATYLAAIEEAHIGKLRPGERATVALIAADRGQARICRNYIAGLLGSQDELLAKVQRSSAESIELDNECTIEIGTNSFRSTRGKTYLAAILDECAFYRDETSANPDLEVFRAIEPGLSTLAPYSMIIGISSPYRKAGLLYEKYARYFGKDDDDVLVIQAPSLTMNPSLDPKIVARAMEEDRASAEAEFGAMFRTDIGEFLPRDVIESCVERGRLVRPPQDDLKYAAFVDASSGTGKDSLALAIGHANGNEAILDCIFEVTPPFSAEEAIGQAAGVLKSYRVRTVQGDRYAPGFVSAAFQRQGVTYQYSEKDRSALYLETLPLLTSGRAKLLDNAKMISQFCGLERRTSAGGKDSIDHGRDRHDDLSNAAAGLLAGIGGRKQPMKITDEMLRLSAMPGPGTRRFLAPSPYGKF